MKKTAILELEGVSKAYPSGDGELHVLDRITLEIERGSICSLVGPSGSGKTTLLGLCAGLDRPTTGRILLDGDSLERMGEDELARVRNQKLGFVFQTFQLIPTLTALENVMVPAELWARKDARSRAEGLLERVGLGGRLAHYPAQLSGGEQQRVAIARAYINEPKILFADEPTGNLDAETGHTVEMLLFELNRQAGTTLVMATHNRELAGRTDRVLTMRAGSIVEDSAATPVS